MLINIIILLFIVIGIISAFYLKHKITKINMLNPDPENIQLIIDLKRIQIQQQMKK